MKRPDDAELWGSSNPLFGQVREVLHDGDHAFVFDDLNGDGREICLRVLRRRKGVWHQVADQDDIGLPDEGSGWMWQDGFVYSWGTDGVGHRFVRAKKGKPPREAWEPGGEHVGPGIWIRVPGAVDDDA
ncbi:MAG: hypothetical protein JWO46_1156 [Nocardioidaceae bacterium]|nr:hypothetical protein [Nocardioidaceae bacterium]